MPSSILGASASALPPRSTRTAPASRPSNTHCAGAALAPRWSTPAQTRRPAAHSRQTCGPRPQAAPAGPRDRANASPSWSPLHFVVSYAHALAPCTSADTLHTRENGLWGMGEKDAIQHPRGRLRRSEQQAGTCATGRLRHSRTREQTPQTPTRQVILGLHRQRLAPDQKSPAISRLASIKAPPIMGGRPTRMRQERNNPLKRRINKGFCIVSL